MEIITKISDKRSKLKAALFDFDGTISTLRHGWENIMEPLMIEMITGQYPAEAALINEVREYIDQSTGVQTYYQMKWLAETVKRYGRNKNASEDPWWYKAEYNKRLMNPVQERKESILSGKKTPSEYLVKGSERFLDALRDRNIEIYVASGTDHKDVNAEAEILGLMKYFKEVEGAPIGRADCSKEAALKKLVSGNNLKGCEMIVIGDGKVEIALGNEVGAITLGVASNEDTRYGVNPVKRTRLIKAGAHSIIGDFEDLDTIINWLGI